MGILNGHVRNAYNDPASGVYVVSGTPPGGPTLNAEAVRAFVANFQDVLFSRLRSAQNQMDPRRSVEVECGYPEEVTSPEIYRRLYDRSPIANRAASVWSAECFQVPFRVFEQEDPGTPTKFEEALDRINHQLRGGGKSWHKDKDLTALNGLCRAADILSGLGGYGCVYYALDDGLPPHQPAKGFKEQGTLPYGYDYQFGTDGRPTRNEDGKLVCNRVPPPAHDPLCPPPYKLVTNQEQGNKLDLNFARVLDESLAMVTRWEGNPNSPRFGMPAQYLLTFSDPRERTTLSGMGMAISSVNVHWSRVVHLADTHHSATSGIAYAVPRLKVVLDTLLGLRKIYGAAPESYWKNSLMRLFFGNENGDVDVDRESIRDVMEKMENSLQRYALIPGLNVQTVAPAVVDPTGFVAVLVEAICVFLKCPVRVFKGSERGELASSQDDEAWNDRLRERQSNYLTPGVVAPILDRLIELGVLPEPTEYFIEWPDLTSQSDDQKMGVALKKVQCLVQYVSGGLDVLMSRTDFLVRVMEFDEEEAASIIENAEAEQEDADAPNMLGRNTMFAVRALMSLYQAAGAQITEEQLRAIMRDQLNLSDEEVDGYLAGGLKPAPQPAPGGPGGKPPGGGGGMGGGGMGDGLRLNAEFREEDHPRADDGKFGQGPGRAAGKGDGGSPAASTPHAEAMKAHGERQAHRDSRQAAADQAEKHAEGVGKAADWYGGDPAHVRGHMDKLTSGLREHLEQMHAPEAARAKFEALAGRAQAAVGRAADKVTKLSEKHAGLSGKMGEAQAAMDAAQKDYDDHQAAAPEPAPDDAGDAAQAAADRAQEKWEKQDDRFVAVLEKAQERHSAAEEKAATAEGALDEARGDLGEVASEHFDRIEEHVAGVVEKLREQLYEEEDHDPEPEAPAEEEGPDDDGEGKKS